MADVFSRESLRQYADGHRAEFEKALETIVEIPTVSVEPERKPDLARGADYAVSLLESLGARAKRYATPGHPIVHGRFDRGGRVAQELQVGWLERGVECLLGHDHAPCQR